MTVLLNYFSVQHAKAAHAIPWPCHCLVGPDFQGAACSSPTSTQMFPWQGFAEPKTGRQGMFKRPLSALLLSEPS